MNNQLTGMFSNGMRGRNNSYPGYPQQYPQQYSQPTVNTNIEFIQGGEQAVNVAQLPYNTMWAFWDNDMDTIYVKSVDGNGRATVDIYDLVHREPGTESQKATVVSADYVTKEQLDQLSENFTQQLADLTKKLNDFKAKVGNNNRKENK